MRLGGQFGRSLLNRRRMLMAVGALLLAVVGYWFSPLGPGGAGARVSPEGAELEQAATQLHHYRLSVEAQLRLRLLAAEMVDGRRPEVLRASLRTMDEMLEDLVATSEGEQRERLVALIAEIERELGRSPERALRILRQLEEAIVGPAGPGRGGIG